MHCKLGIKAKILQAQRMPLKLLGAIIWVCATPDKQLCHVVAFPCQRPNQRPSGYIDNIVVVNNVNSVKCICKPLHVICADSRWELSPGRKRIH